MRRALRLFVVLRRDAVIRLAVDPLGSGVRVVFVGEVERSPRADDGEQAGCLGDDHGGGAGDLGGGAEVFTQLAIGVVVVRQAIPARVLGDRGEWADSLFVVGGD